MLPYVRNRGSIPLTRSTTDNLLPANRAWLEYRQSPLSRLFFSTPPAVGMSELGTALFDTSLVFVIAPESHAQRETYEIRIHSVFIAPWTLPDVAQRTYVREWDDQWWRERVFNHIAIGDGKKSIFLQMDTPHGTTVNKKLTCCAKYIRLLSVSSFNFLTLHISP